MQFIGDGQPWSLERTQQFLLRAQEMSRTAGFCQWCVTLRSGSGSIGFCGLVPAPGGAEIGWRLSRRFWGQGLATEAAQAVIAYGFEVLGLKQILCTVQAANVGSLRVVEKLGMHLDSTFERDGREVMRYRLRAPHVSPGDEE